MVDIDQKDSFVDDKAQSKRGILTLSSIKLPQLWGQRIKPGTIPSINEQHVAPEENPGLLTRVSAPILRLSGRRWQCACHMHGHSGGVGPVCLWHCHDPWWLGHTYSVIYKSHGLPHTIFSLDLASWVLTDYLRKILTEWGHSFSPWLSGRLCMTLRRSYATLPWILDKK